MRKLELKELAAYLPYGLTGILTPQKDVVKFTGIVVDAYGSHEVQIDGEGVYALSRFKPILRPLSDLKDDSFIDINNQYPNTPNWDYYKESWIESGKNLSDTIIEYCVMQWLIENHFDVFGLIPYGLAIDVNTLNKE